MKAEMKAVVASIVVIALALTAVSGVTYSWFSDTEKAEIDVTTAVVDYDASYTTTSTGDSIISPVTGEEPSKSFKIDNLAANAKFVITPNITNKSSIDTIYRIYVTYTLTSSSNIDSNDLANILVNGTSLKDSNKIVVQSWTPVSKSTNNEGDIVTAPSFTISTPTTYEIPQGAPAHSGLIITVALEAYQSSYATPVDSSGGSVVIPDNGVISGQVDISVSEGESPEKAQLAVTFPEDAKDSTFTASVSKDFSSNYTISATIDGTTTFSSPVTMVITLPGNLTDRNVIYLGTTSEQPIVLSKIYNATDRTTTITFTTTHFSDFMVAKDVVAIADTNDGVQVYSNLSEAINATTGTVVLVDSVEISQTITTNKDYTLDLNGKNITADGVRAIHIQSGIVTIEGNGNIESTGNIGEWSSVIRVGDNSATSSAKLTVDKDVNVNVDVTKVYGIAVFGKNNTELDFNGNVTSKDTPAISGNGHTDYRAATNAITIGAGATVTTSSTSPAIYQPQNGTLTVNGTVDGGIEIKGGTVIINDGAKVSAHGTPSYNPTDGDPSTNGYAVAIVYNENYPAINSVTISDSANIGTIGCFGDDDYDYAVLKSGTTYNVLKFSDVLSKAKSGDTIILINDIVTEGLTFDNTSLTLDLNGHNINLGAKRLSVQSAASLDITGKGTISSSNAIVIGIYGSTDNNSRNKLIINEDVTISGSSWYSVTLFNADNKETTPSYCDITLKGTYTGGLYVNGTVKNTGETASKITVNSAKISGQSYLGGYSIFKAEKTTFDGGNGTPLSIKGGEIELSGCTFISTMTYDNTVSYSSVTNGDLSSNCLVKVDYRDGYSIVSKFTESNSTFTKNDKIYSVLVLYNGTVPTAFTSPDAYCACVDKASSSGYITGIKVTIDTTEYTVDLFFKDYASAKTFFDGKEDTYKSYFGTNATINNYGTLGPN